MLSASEDEETQKRGCVFIFFQNSPTVQVFTDPQERQMFQRLFDTIPLRTSAIHVCLCDTGGEPDKFQKLQANAMDSFGTEARSRIRLHTGEVYPPASKRTFGEDISHTSSVQLSLSRVAHRNYK
jgi:hypothetical protein